MRSFHGRFLFLSCAALLAACGDEADQPSDDAGIDAAVDMGATVDTRPSDVASKDAVVSDALVSDAQNDAAADAGCGSLLARGRAEFSEAMGAVELKKSDGALFSTLNLDFGFGSAAFRDPKDPEGVFWAVTDRGPNYDCDTVYCTTTDNKIFAKPTFSPTIVKVTLGRSEANGCALNVSVSNKLPILDKDGAAVTGLPISPAYVKEEAVGPNQAIIADNDNGMDTEGLVRLADGTFWLAEEYGPSLVHVDAAGKVVERVTPEGVKPNGSAPYAPNYAVTDGLPGILIKRKSNRGFEALSLSPDGKFLYTALQSPMQNPNKATGDASLVIRIHKVSLKPNGAFDKVEGEWLYLLDTEATFKLSDNAAVKRTDLKISEMVALGTDDLLVEERTDFVAKIYRVKLSTAAPLDVNWDALATDPSLEKYDATNVAFAGVTAVAKVAVFDGVAYAAANQTPVLPGKLEGITILGDYLVFVNDNDFNASQKTIVTLLPLPAAAK